MASARSPSIKRDVGAERMRPASGVEVMPAAPAPQERERGCDGSSMMRMRRRLRWLGISAVILALGWVLFARLQAWNNIGELRLAQQDMARGQLTAAQKRLALLAARPGVLGGAADYWLGICEALSNRPEAALRLRPATRNVCI